MSRSYKRYPHFSDNDNGGAKIAKRFANKRVRQTPGIFNGGSYRKLYGTWDIRDWKFTDYDWSKDRPYYVEDHTQWIWVELEGEWGRMRPMGKHDDPNYKWWRGYFK